MFPMFPMIYNLFGFVEVRILPLLFGNDDIMTAFVTTAVFKLEYFVEHNISCQPSKFQSSRLSGSNFTEGGGIGKQPVL